MTEQRTITIPACAQHYDIRQDLTQQAEAERPELWAVHTRGPDELYAAFSREDADKHAADLNALPMPEGITVDAVVVPSPWPEAEHWKYLAEQERDHKNEIAGRLRHFERICEGLPQDAIDGGWTVQGIRAHSKQLEEQLKVAQAEVEALRAGNSKLSEALDRWPLIRERLNLRLDFALDKISKLESRWRHGESPEERFEHYISNTIDRAPEPLRRLGNWLSHVLDEDQWTTAERMLTGACVAAEERAAAQTQHSVPEGWKLVPVEPTEDVLEAIHNGGYVGDDQELRWFYQSILAAAPAPGGE